MTDIATKDKNQTDTEGQPIATEATGSDQSASVPDATAKSGAGKAAEANAAPELEIRLSRDKLAVLLTCPAPLEDLTPLLVRLDAELRGLGLPNLPDWDELEQLVRNLGGASDELVEAKLLEGEPPVPAIDGRIEWAKDFFTDGFKVDEETGAMDYWERLEDLSVHADDVLATVYPPIPGRPGRDLLGRTIKVDKPQKASIRLGPNVRQEEADDGVIVFLAGMNGRLRWADGVVAVDQVLTVRGNVGLETGHIRHPGAVMINGDILNGARIEAEGDVVVKGMLEPCWIIAGGNLTVQGGVVGSKEHLIELGGGLQAKYLLEVRVEAGDDIEVTNEITKSDVKTRGAVRIPKGRIVGSEVMARRGLEVGQAGGEGASSTTLISGVDFRLAVKLAEKKQRIKKLKRQIEKIQRTIEQVMDRKRALTTCEREAAKELLYKGRDVKAEMDELRAEARKLKEQAENGGQSGEDCSIKVLRTTYQDTFLQIGEAKKRVPRRIPVPRCYSARGEEIMVSPLEKE